MTTASRRHHFVPRAYLRRFSVDGCHVYTLFKNGSKKIINDKPTHTDKLCVEKDFYTVSEHGNDTNVGVEESLAKFEDLVPNAIFSQMPPDLIYPYRDRGVILDARQQAMLVYSIAIQIVRGKVVRQYGLSKIDQVYDNILAEAREKFRDSPTIDREVERLRSASDRLKTNTLAEGPIIEMIKGPNGSDIFRALQQRACIIFINTTTTNFVTSDEPVLVCDATKQDVGIEACPLGSPSSIVYYPLDSKHLVALYPQDFYPGINSSISGFAVFLTKKDDAFINAVNLAQLLQCNRCLISQDRKTLLDISANGDNM